jgi:fatty acid desaturase
MDHQDLDDYSQKFSALRSGLVGGKGTSYLAFVRTLEPNYPQVYRDIAFGYACLALTLVLVATLAAWGLPKLLASIFGAVSIGYWVAYLQLFLHEGAHYNLAPDKAKSDRITDRAIAWLIGTSVETYRKVHFQHHRALGTPEDSEFSYFFPLNLKFLVKGLTGLRAIEVLLSRRSVVKDKSKVQRDAVAASHHANNSILLGLAIHALILALCLALGLWWVALAWIGGVFSMFPLFGALRQLLEHRSFEAEPGIDYARQSHGALTRLFGDDLFSSTFGAAGFNRHLLHHWEPQVSYTNLPALESFLMQTQVGPIIEARRTTYAKAFRQLFAIH